MRLPAGPVFFFFFCPNSLDALTFPLLSCLKSHHQIAVEIARRSAVSLAAAHAAVSGKRVFSCGSGFD